jgi:O-antigen ligase
MFKDFKLFSKQTIPLVIAFLLGFVNLLLGASRGPLASFFILAILVLITHTYLTRKNLAYFLRLFFVFILSAVLSLMYIVPLILSGKLSVINRTAQTLDKNLGEEVRAYQWRAAWEQIKTSPVWGERIVENYTNFYPHNFFIEIVLATGILGAILFMFIFTDLFRRFLTAVRENNIAMVLYFLLGLQFLYGLSGLSIPTGCYVWMLIAVCLSCSINQKSNYLGE